MRIMIIIKIPIISENRLRYRPPYLPEKYILQAMINALENKIYHFVISDLDKFSKKWPMPVPSLSRHLITLTR